MNKNMLPPIIAAAVTLLVYFATKSLWHMWVGPMLIIFFAIWSFQVSIMNKWKFNRLGLLPCIIGIFGFIWGLQSVSAGLSYIMSGCEWNPRAFLATAIEGISLAFDVLALGCGVSLFLFAFSVSILSCRRSIKE